MNTQYLSAPELETVAKLIRFLNSELAAITAVQLGAEVRLSDANADPIGIVGYSSEHGGYVLHYPEPPEGWSLNE